MPRALITGITGQDGSYLAELLLSKGYEVHGAVRPESPPGPVHLEAVLQNPNLPQDRLHLHRGDIEEISWLRHLLETTEPEEVYHLAAPSDVATSFKQIEDSYQFIVLATLRLLESLAQLRPSARVFHASSSEIFGRPESAPQDELTPFRPVTPYGCAKTFATNLVTLYRCSFGLFASNGILYNHESPRRSGRFVTQKICTAAAAIRAGRQKELLLGNLTACRDWGDARDYVRGMWLALQHDTPDDFIFATGQLHSIEDVLQVAFGTAGLDWRPFVRHDPRLLRPQDPARLIGNAGKARRLLGWEPESTFESVIAEMTRAALAKGTGGST